MRAKLRTAADHSLRGRFSPFGSRPLAAAARPRPPRSRRCRRPPGPARRVLVEGARRTWARGRAPPRPGRGGKLNREAVGPRPAGGQPRPGGGAAASLPRPPPGHGGGGGPGRGGALTGSPTGRGAAVNRSRAREPGVPRPRRSLPAPPRARQRHGPPPPGPGHGQQQPPQPEEEPPARALCGAPR